VSINGLLPEGSPPFIPCRVHKRIFKKISSSNGKRPGFLVKCREEYMIWLIFKLKIEERMGKECLVCISFHIAEYPLRYPYINGRR
jgi:hypothetical protein